MDTNKKDKRIRIRDLEREVLELKGQQANAYYFASANLKSASTRSLTGGGVVLQLNALGGKALIDPIVIRDGLSEATIEALKADLLRSYELATMYKPLGYKIILPEATK